MAKHSSSILELARRGAQHRYQELKAELDSLVRHFPSLRSGTREVVRRGRRAVKAGRQAATEDVVPAVQTTLVPGKCINDIDGTQLQLPGTTPHDGEVYAVFTLPNGSYPG